MNISGKVVENGEQIEEECEVEEEDPFVQDIVQVMGQEGIGKKDIEGLRSLGVNTVKGCLMTPNKALIGQKFDEKKVEKLKIACNRIVYGAGGVMPFLTALEVSDQRRQIFKIQTGSKNLDRLFDGGIDSMSITEICGESRTGKTQLAHTLSVTTQIPVNNTDYSGGKVLFIDTENTFRPQRLKQIANRFNLNHKAVLENVLYARAYTCDHQIELLKNAAKRFHEDAGVFKLLIVDSIMALFRTDFCGRGELSIRQQKLAQTLSILQKISEEFNIAVFVTNQVTSVMQSSILEPDMLAQKPSGGNIMAHAATTRVCLKKAPGNTRLAHLYDSPELEECEMVFTITRGGVADPKEPPTVVSTED